VAMPRPNIRPVIYHRASTPKQLVEQFNYKAKTRTLPPLFSKLLTHGH
jgi:hypothetical protein